MATTPIRLPNKVHSYTNIVFGIDVHDVLRVGFAPIFILVRVGSNPGCLEY